VTEEHILLVASCEMNKRKASTQVVNVHQTSHGKTAGWEYNGRTEGFTNRQRLTYNRDNIKRAA
jgi:hypothetical protein